MKSEEVTPLHAGGKVRKKSPAISSLGVIDSNPSGIILIKE